MAGNVTLAFAIKAINESQKALKEIQGDLKATSDKAEQATKHTGGLGSALGTMGKIAGGIVLGSGILQAPNFLMSAAQAAADDAASTAKLKQAVDNTGVSYDSLAGSLQATISHAQKMAFTDDQARDALSLLTAQTGSAEEAQKRFGLAMDLARGANIDVVTASKLLGKVTEDNVNVLGRYGIKVAEGASETELFGAIQAKFGGQAETFAKSTAGQMEQVKIQMGELKEKIGTALLPVMTTLGKVLVEDVIPALNQAADWVGTNLIPVVEDMARIFREDVVPVLRDDVLPVIQEVAQTALQEFLIPALDTLKQGWDDLKPSLVTIAGFLNDNIVPVLKTVGQFLLDHKPLLIALAGAILLLIAPWLAVVAALVIVLAKWDEIKAMFTETIPVAIDSVLTKIREIPIIGEIFQATFDNVKAILTAAWASIKVEVETAINVVRDIIKIVTALIHGDWSEAWEGVKALVGHIWEGIRALIEIHLELIKTLIWNQLQLVAGIVADLWRLGPNSVYNTIVGAMTDAKNWVSDRIDDIVGFFMGLPGRIRDELSGLGTIIDTAFKAVSDLPINAFKWGQELVQALVRGIRNRLGDIDNVIRDIIKKINPLNWDLPGPLSPFLLAFQHAGQLIVGKLAEGIEDQKKALEEKIRMLQQQLSRISDPNVRAAIIAEWKATVAELNFILAGINPPASGGGDGDGDGKGPPIYGNKLAAFLGQAIEFGGALQQVKDQVSGALNSLRALGSKVVTGEVPPRPAGDEMGRIGLVLNDSIQTLGKWFTDARTALLPFKLLAAGGIVRSPTLALLGERGPEAVIPLNRGGGAPIEVNIYVQALDGESFRRIIPRLKDELRLELRRAMG